MDSLGEATGDDIYAIRLRCGGKRYGGPRCYGHCPACRFVGSYAGEDRANQRIGFAFRRQSSASYKPPARACSIEGGREAVLRYLENFIEPDSGIYAGMVAGLRRRDKANDSAVSEARHDLRGVASIARQNHAYLSESWRGGRCACWDGGGGRGPRLDGRSDLDDVWQLGETLRPVMSELAKPGSILLNWHGRRFLS